MNNKTIRLKTQAFFYGMVLLPCTFLFIFNYIPMFGIIMAFQDYKVTKGIFNSPFVGFKNLEYMFALPDSYRVFRNTVLICLGKIVLGMLIAVIFAILLNEIRHRRLKRSVQTIVYLPHFLSWVILTAVVVNMFNLDGPVNQLFVTLGLNRINFMGSNEWIQPLLIGTDVWKEFGYSSIIYLAALTSIDPGLYEAAMIDGATWRKRVWHITLPGLMPIIMLMAAVSLANILSAGFDQVYNLYHPLVYERADILDTYVYRIGLVARKYGFATSVGLLKSIIGMGLMLLCNEMAKRYADRKIF